MRLVNVEELFYVKYGVNLDLNKLEKTEVNQGIRYIGRTEKNNGVTAWVEQIPGKNSNPPMTISVAGGGSVLSAFVQECPYYSGRDLFYLEPKQKMGLNELLFYTTILRKNKFKFSYGRQANRTLHNLKIPLYTDIPAYVLDYKINNNNDFVELEKLKKEVFKIGHDLISGTVNNSLKDLFDIVNGVNATSFDVRPYRFANSIPIVRPSKWQSTSYAGFIDKNEIPTEKIFPADTLYIGTNGAGSHTYAYVSIEEFTLNSDVAVLLPKKNMSREVKLAYATLITYNRYKFSYGRKPKGSRMEAIKLP